MRLNFDQVAQAASHNVIAEALAAVFRSDQTPAFGSLVGNLFSQSSGEQKAGMLNQLLASVGPAALAQLAGGGTLAGLLGSTGKELYLIKPRKFRRKWCSSWLPMRRRQTRQSWTRPAPFMPNIPEEARNGAGAKGCVKKTRKSVVLYER